MLTDKDISDNVIKIYLEIYLKALNEKKPEKYTQIIKSRLQELLKHNIV